MLCIRESACKFLRHHVKVVVVDAHFSPSTKIYKYQHITKLVIDNQTFCKKCSYKCIKLTMWLVAMVQTVRYINKIEEKKNNC